MRALLTYLFLISSIIVCAQVENNTSQIGTGKKLVQNINNPNHVDYAPSISADGKTIIFESDRNKGWKLFETKMDEQGKWSTPLSLDKINNFGRKTDLIAGPNLSYDGNSLFFFGFFMFQSESEDIFLSNRENGGWSEPKALPYPINTEAYEGFPSISTDGNTLYFIRLNDKNPEYISAGGVIESCFVIWKSDKDQEGNWGEPVELPAPINLGCERSPRIMADNQTLLFSSIREGSLGLYDMYQTTKLGDGSWSPPIALDYVNTEENDLSPCIAAAGDLMYYYSDDDIYQVPIPAKYRQNKNITIEGFVKAIETETPLPAQITISNKNSGEVLSILENNRTDGWFSVVLTKGLDYEIEFSSPGYAAKSNNFDLRELKEYREEHLEINLTDKILLKAKVIDAELLTPEKATVSVELLSGESVGKFLEADQFEQWLKLNSTYVIRAESKNHRVTIDTVQTAVIDLDKLERVIGLSAMKKDVLIEVVDLQNNSRVKSKLILNNKNRDEKLEYSSDQFVSLRDGDRYQVETNAPGYFFGAQEIVTDELVAGPDGKFRVEAIKVQKIVEGVSLLLKGINFDTNSSKINEASEAELIRIENLLKSNQNIVVQISAHTDDVGDNQYNLDLSTKRAESVIDHLIGNGISRENLVAIGYGMSRPSVPNDNEENRMKNRRVELTILKIK